MWITRNESTLTKMDLDASPTHVAGGAAFISISCEVPIRVGGCTPLYNRGTRWKAVGRRQSRKGRAGESVQNRSTLIEQFAYASNERLETHLPYSLTQLYEVIVILKDISIINIKDISNKIRIIILFLA